MVNPIDWIHEKYRFVRYHSARRRRTRWRKASDRWFVASPFVAIVLVVAVPLPASLVPGSSTLTTWLAELVLGWLVILALGVGVIQMTRFCIFMVHGKDRPRIERVRPAGLCHKCGYDMRGNIYSDRCPECGAIALP